MGLYDVGFPGLDPHIRQHEEREEDGATARDRKAAQRPDLPLRFDALPRNLQNMVLKHTAASFVVEWRTIEQANLHGVYIGPVPVISRWAFKLARRRASGPEMTAKFTKALDPQFKSTLDWRLISEPWQKITLEHWGELSDYHDNIKEVRVDVNESDKHPSLLYFINRNAEVQKSHCWSGFHHNTLFEVRDKLLSEFGMHLRDARGRLVCEHQLVSAYNQRRAPNRRRPPRHSRVHKSGASI